MRMVRLFAVLGCLACAVSWAYVETTARAVGVAATATATPATTAPAGLAADARQESVREGPAVLEPKQAAARGVGDLVGDVAFTDVDGKAGRLSDYRGRPATVVCFTEVGCPVAKKYGPTLARLEQQYRDRGVAVLVVNPDAGESPDRLRAAAAALKAAGFGGRYVCDPKGDVVRRLGASSSTEAFVLDAALTLVYRGAVDDQYGLGYALPGPRRTFLADAIDATLAGRASAVAATTAPGCALDPKAAPAADPAAPITYHNRISRLFQRNCQECHRPGENAPFALTTYAEARDHLAMIRKVVARGVMPPWFAEPKVGHWANDRTMTDRDRDDLLAWAAAGGPEGDPRDAPLPRPFADGWKIGKPDAVFEADRPVIIPAKGPIPYRYVMVPTKLTEDKWVKAIEVRTPNPQVVHHLLVFVMFPPDHPKAREQIDFKAGVKGYFAGLVPGQSATTFPDGTAKFLPKGATLVFQVHYTPDGTPVEDRPKIGFVFADKPPAHEVMTLAAANQRFRIPPGADDYEVSATYRFTGPARLLSFNPHSHVRGKAWRYELTYPDGRTETVLDVPRYDFNWQLEYQLAAPLDVPEGTVLKATAWYDNSDKNPANPDPSKTVRFGEQTSDEMMIGYFTGHRLP